MPDLRRLSQGLRIWNMSNHWHCTFPGHLTVNPRPTSVQLLYCEIMSLKQKAVKSGKQHEGKGSNPLVGKYDRGALDIKVKAPRSKLAKEKTERAKTQILDAATRTSATEILLPSSAGEIELEDPTQKIYKLKHREVVQNVDLNTARNAFNFQLQEFGPYFVDYSRNGRSGYN